jgi:hypothetical protein
MISVNSMVNPYAKTITAMSRRYWSLLSTRNDSTNDNLGFFAFLLARATAFLVSYATSARPFAVVNLCAVSAAFSWSVNRCTNQCNPATPTPAAVIIPVNTFNDVSNAASSSLDIICLTHRLTPVMATPDRMGAVLPMREINGYTRFAWCNCTTSLAQDQNSNGMPALPHSSDTM